jgi:hypothetical protein
VFQLLTDLPFCSKENPQSANPIIFFVAIEFMSFVNKVIFDG